MSIYKTRTVWHHAMRPTQKLWCHIFGWLSNEIKSEPKRIAPTVADRQLVFELVLRVVREQDRWGNRKSGVGTRSDPMFACCIRLKDIQYKGKATNPIERQTQEQMYERHERMRMKSSAYVVQRSRKVLQRLVDTLKGEVWYRMATEVTYSSSLNPCSICYFIQGIEINKHIE